jgi:hypothetical protein
MLNDKATPQRAAEYRRVVPYDNAPIIGPALVKFVTDLGTQVSQHGLSEGLYNTIHERGGRIRTLYERGAENTEDVLKRAPVVVIGEHPALAASAVGLISALPPRIDPHDESVLVSTDWARLHQALEKFILPIRLQSSATGTRLERLYEHFHINRAPLTPEDIAHNGRVLMQGIQRVRNGGRLTYFPDGVRPGKPWQALEWLHKLGNRPDAMVVFGTVINGPKSQADFAKLLPLLDRISHFDATVLFSNPLPLQPILKSTPLNKMDPNALSRDLELRYRSWLLRSQQALASR